MIDPQIPVTFTAVQLMHIIKSMQITLHVAEKTSPDDDFQALYALTEKILDTVKDALVSQGYEVRNYPR